MKNINKFLFIVFALFMCSTSFAQSALDNGRDEGLQASSVESTDVEPAQQANEFASDQDVPGLRAPQPEGLWVLPDDLEAISDELYNSSNSAEVVEKVNKLQSLLEQLVLSNERLKQENETIKKSLSLCCINNGLSLSSEDAYLQQNAPNPFNQSSKINYFVPEGSVNAVIRISDVRGEILDEYDLKDGGFGEIQLDGDAIETGAYIYTLSIDDKVIDSKVLMITK